MSLPPLRSGVAIWRPGRPVALLTACLAAAMANPSHGAIDLIAIGDSLTADYTDYGDFQDYGDVTVPGWRSRSWYEVLALTRGGVIGVGGYASNWDLVRSSGYEYDWATPGVTAADVRYRWSSTDLGNWLTFYPIYNNTLQNHLQNRAEAVSILLGANDFNDAYGAIANGADPSGLIGRVTSDIQWVINRVQSAKSTLPIVLVSIPDLGATPDVRASVPDPAKRAIVAAAIERVNSNLQAMAVAEGIAFADIYPVTRDLVQGQTLYFGAVDLIYASDPDNNPRFLFCRDGFHPNTCAQAKMANVILGALNQRYGFGFAPILNSEALALLGINPDQPYLDWIAGFGVSRRGMGDDAESDGAENLLEYALFGGDPSRPGGHAPLEGVLGDGPDGPVLTLTFRPDPAHARHVRITAESSRDMMAWEPVGDLSQNPDGSWTAVIAAAPAPAFLRLRVRVIPPDEI